MERRYHAWSRQAICFWGNPAMAGDGVALAWGGRDSRERWSGSVLEGG